MCERERERRWVCACVCSYASLAFVCVCVLKWWGGVSRYRTRWRSCDIEMRFWMHRYYLCTTIIRPDTWHVTQYSPLLNISVLQKLGDILQEVRMFCYCARARESATFPVSCFPASVIFNNPKSMVTMKTRVWLHTQTLFRPYHRNVFCHCVDLAVTQPLVYGHKTYKYFVLGLR